MFLFNGMQKPWWAAATVVWLLVTFALVITRGFNVQAASRIALVPAVLVGFGVWWAVGRDRAQPPQ